MNFRNLLCGDASTRRPEIRRRPIVENLEGRQLLSGIIGSHIGTNVVADVQKIRQAVVEAPGGGMVAAGILHQGGHFPGM